MPWNTILFKPGVDAVRSEFIPDNGWNASNLIRFRSGLPEKNGGWAHVSNTPLTGVARGSDAWADLTGLPYYAAGSDQMLQLLSNTGLSDITPLRLATTPPVNFSTIINTPTVTIVDAGMPVDLAATDWVNIDIPISIGGLVLHGTYQVATIVSPTSYTVTAVANATATVNNGGVVPTFTSTNLSTLLKVTLPNHGLTGADVFVVEVALTIATVVLGAYSSWPVANVLDADNFQITTTAANANAGPTAENGGNASLQYLVASGFSSANLIGGFGQGLFGSGYYGTNTNGVTYTTIRQWFMDEWGQDLVCNYPQSPIFVYVPPVALGNRAIAINTTNFPSATSPPAKVNVSFVAMPEQILVALGVDPSGGGTQDTNLVRWCSVADFTDWVASATNQAGSFRLPHGSRIVGGLVGPSFLLIWTDVDMWIVAYIGFPLVFGFNNIANIGMIAGRCCVQAETSIYWVANNNIYRFDGSSPTILPCPVWDIMWDNLNRTQIDKCFMTANSWFNEIAVFFPSATGNGEVDSYIRYNYRENIWDYGVGTLYACTTWIDESVFGPPISVDLAGLIQQHEIAFDADGQQMMEFIQSDYFNLDAAWLLTAVDQVISDFKFTGSNGSVLYWVLTVNYPSDTPIVNGPFTSALSAAQIENINSQGRMVSIKIGMSSVGCGWRLGYTRYLFSSNGSI